MTNGVSNPGSSNFSDLLADVPQVTDIAAPLCFQPGDEKRKNIFAAHPPRRSWDKATEARCDFTRRVRLTKRSGVFFISLWQKSLYGRTLTEIKQDEAMIDFFSAEVGALMREVLGENLPLGQWALCTTPKRRHKERNFATEVSRKMALMLGVPFYEDVALCHNRQRVGAEFSLNVLPAERNIIVFDDFVTTGQTMRGMQTLLLREKKNLLFFTGINNQL